MTHFNKKKEALTVVKASKGNDFLIKSGRVAYLKSERILLMLEAVCLAVLIASEAFCPADCSFCVSTLLTKLLRLLVTVPESWSVTRLLEPRTRPAAKFFQ